ncbi:hypothetical protein [Streptomyces sp. NPDC127084]|uniref:hypothetical protein n=1 Tax=Streptomyces sp. NPDC127084 TaxID=3347133 RepID=UPI0036514A31
MAPRPQHMTHGRSVPYQSSACLIGVHPECAQSDPIEVPAGVPVIYESCVCPCHQAGDHGSPAEVAL